MTIIAAILNHPLVREVGWTLLHSLWQGALIGLLFVVLRVALRRRSAKMRYLTGCACLALLAVAPVLTLLLGLAAVPTGGAGHDGMHGATSLLAAGSRPASLGTPFHGDGDVWRLAGSTDFLTRLAPALVLGWLLGVMFFSARLTRSCWSVRGIRTRDNEPVEAVWLEMLDELRHRLGVSQPVRLLKSALVEVPTVIGCFRPVILLPAATLSGLTPGQLEAILAHELAHVRRLDYLVNAFQCLVETLMFYHPVAWWISRCIREERENCCDDLVVEVCSDRLGYARALAALEGLRAELPEVAFAASGGSLLGRIRRLVGAGNRGGRTTVREAGGLALLGVGLVLIFLGVRMLLTPTNYQSAARIGIEHDQTQAHKQIMDEFHSLVNPTWHPLTAPISYDPYFLQTEFELIQSEAILGKVIESLDLNREWGKKYANGRQLKTSETIGLLKGRIDLRPTRGVNRVEVLAVSEKPDEAARIANAVAEAYRAQRREQRTQLSKEGIKALEARFQEQQKKVKGAQQKVDKLREELSIKNTLASAESPTPLMTADTRRKLEDLRVEQTAKYVRQAALLERLRTLEKDLGPEGLAQALPKEAPDELLSALLQSLGTAERRLESLTKEYGPSHSDVIKAHTQVDILHRKVNNRASGIMLLLETRSQSLSNSLYTLEQEVSRAITNDVIIVNQTRPYFEAKRNLEEMQRFRQILDVKIASQNGEVRLPDTEVVDIIDRATPATRPISPNLRGGLVVIALGVLLDITGLLMLRGRPGAALEPPPA